MSHRCYTRFHVSGELREGNAGCRPYRLRPGDAKVLFAVDHYFRTELLQKSDRNSAPGVR